MKIGRLILERPFWGLSCLKGSCGCILISTPIVHITWIHKNCRCSICKQNICECICPLCDQKYIECDCEDFK